MIPAGLKELDEDGQEMEESPISSNEVAPMESHDLDKQGKLPKIWQLTL